MPPKEPPIEKAEEHQSDTQDAVRVLGPCAGKRAWLGGRCISVRRRAERWLEVAERPATGPIDLVVICPDTPDEAVYFAEKLRGRLSPDTVMWVVIEATDNQHPQAFPSAMDEGLDRAIWLTGPMETADGCRLWRLYATPRT